MLRFINQYNSTDRKVIKENLKRLMKEKGFSKEDIIKLGYGKHNVMAWINSACNNIPMFWQSLDLAVNFNFDVTEFLQESQENIENKAS